MTVLKTETKTETAVFPVIPTETNRVLAIQNCNNTNSLLLDKHVTSLSAKCFFQLRQLCCIRSWLDNDSITTLVHAFVTSRVDYCVGQLAGAPKKMIDKLQRILNTAA